MGQDLVAVDATCARVMGLNPGKVPYLAPAGRVLGNLEQDASRNRASRFPGCTTFDIRPGLKALAGEELTVKSFLAAGPTPAIGQFALVSLRRRVVVPHLELALDSATRRKGLLGRDGLDPAPAW